MTYRLHLPTEGFNTFALYRRSNEEEVTVSIGGATYLLDSEELRQWLDRIKWENAAKLVDLCWSFRAITCDRSINRYTIDERQVHPDDADARDSALDVFLAVNPGTRQ